MNQDHASQRCQRHPCQSAGVAVQEGQAGLLCKHGSHKTHTCSAASSSCGASAVAPPLLLPPPRAASQARADFCSTRRSALPTAARRCDGSSSCGDQRTDATRIDRTCLASSHVAVPAARRFRRTRSVAY